MTNKTELYSSFKTKKTTNDNLKSFAAPIDNEGAAIVIDTPNINAGVNAGGFFGTYVDMEGSAKTEAELIKKYREAAAYPECDMAIEDIVNEAISDLENESVVRIILDDIDVGIGLKKKMEAEFKSVLKLLDFKSNAHSIFKRWYIDGRIYFHKILDTNNPAGGIQELRYLDPRRMKKVVSVEQQKDKRTGNIIFGKKSEFFVYTTVDQNAKSNAYQFQGQNSTKGIKIPVEEIAYCTSGEIDYDRNIVMSFLHKALKIVNQIRMMEDAMVIYRMSRAAERRIFYVNTGNMPKAQSEAHVNDLMNRYRNKSVYDACLSMDTRIPLLDGRVLTLKEMQTEHEAGKEMWVYSCDPITGKFAPGLVSSAGITKFDQNVMKLTLDNGETITCTLDHKFPVWNKGKVEARDLIVGDSMIPFYTRNEVIHGSKSPYQQIFENASKKWKFTHREVSTWKDLQGIDNEYVAFKDELNKNTVHHKDYNRFNNLPTNLTRMSRDDNFEYRNHKITNIEFLTETMDVGTLGIDKEEIYHNYHTFALESGIYTCNSTGEIRDDRKFSAMIEDFWIPRQDGSNSTEIDTLEGGTNMSDLGDVAYFQKNLYKALNIPASRIGTDGTMINFGRQSEVNRDEIKFSKFVQRLRLKFQEILIDVLKTQLILKGIFTAQDWESVVDDIVLEFSQDSYYAETKESEIIRNRVEILNEMQPLVGVYFDREYVFKKILRLTDDEISAMQEGISNDLALGYGMGGMPVPPPEEQDNNIPDGNMPALPQQPQG
jgi:hypothetical protein